MFEEGNAILQQQFALLQAAHEKLVRGWVEHQVLDHQIEVAVLDL